jgi:micrococcal nuclease
MLRLLVITGAIVAAGCAAANSSRHTAAQPHTSAVTRQTFTVERVVDGDTIKVARNGDVQTVRLIGIDTPETHKPGVKVECGGREASANMERLAPAGHTATLVSDPTQDKVDRYGRTLAYVTVDHHSLQLGQLRAGLAEVYVYGGHPFQRVDSFRHASDVAKKHGRGVWGECSGDFHSEQSTS